MIKRMYIENKIEVDNKLIDVKTEINIDKEVDIFEFYLSKLLNIKEITTKTEGLNYTTEEGFNLEFRSECQKIIVDIPKDIDSITVYYNGKVEGWHNDIKDDIVTLNFYSAWYPMFKSIEDEKAEKVVTLLGLEEFRVLKGERNQDKWIYKSQDLDCNIIAVKDWDILSSNINGLNLRVYSSTEKDKKHANYIINSFRNVIEFYTSKFQAKEVSKSNFNILINSSVKSGGYCREGLIVLSKLPENDDAMIDHFIGHEAAHLWAIGADINTWEDWLNETFAECMALTFIKEVYGEEKYDEYMEGIRERAQKYPQIKTRDGKRPEGVHAAGTYLFHELKVKFGEEVFIEIIKLFIKLDKKTTEKLLNSVRENINEEITIYIERGISE
ncbi:hypothetical protein GOQ27_12860 [Clostridium sp. D2Q-11]|uniref:Peptidase M1 membrane alanine aminopeptidase domain-containing protein n=1 Tax=Anaeromonas frigoriresistens TaxID=2683708 RepID=A0A942UYX4_9FIRM|nr:hypothetical protein [Anaeromonas frigoriresistens]MBS4539359.1 hypothetical protein [Anaeromonas frigoriresistens]